MTVGILVVSHSAAIASGTVELARQMAADVPLVAAGGTDDGGIGTSFDAITAGIDELASADAVVVLCDLGSAYLTTDTALDFLDDDLRARVHVSDAPVVEGTVAAAVAAQTGGDVQAVLAAADTAAASEADAGGASRPDQTAGPVPVTGTATGPRVAASTTVELVNETGLHARPAAEFVKTAARFDAAVHVNGVDAKSLLGIMALALPKGATLTIEATGDDAQDAVDALDALVRSGFGEH
ncbi:dihydroxyacetone kinase phosphoryl donor subunit DhaM [Curtobacterium sp. VKM Ac-2922]|uniref:dihydroxyacetone kinase phosphoryl donor subunit DhaM n=1 Tax=Curtobacterium sp. VKM Ac-2922 TaxID=2929475 RepID=UPI001FB3AACE|nr:dihydroxyacetone kinase phosphoryl donor subunit DhaM [Curtobacterium sp. VKM Ac-2922]MCJ1714836.1 PTS-dependent dihydroxyacetone kinase phosphotransferase subunit DhaM [Curtobacterium sp. VKM Ac-2922]